MGTIRLLLTEQLLRDVLRLPDDARVTDFEYDDEEGSDSLEIFIESEFLPGPAVEGDPVPTYKPTYAVGEFGFEDGTVVQGTTITGFGLDMGMAYADSGKPVVLMFNKAEIIADE